MTRSAADRTKKTQREAIRTVALFEGFKGVIVLLAASGLLALVHQDLHAFAARFIEHMHLNPASKYPTIFLDAVDRAQDTGLKWLALGAAAYATLRLIEAYGLFHERAWAELLAAVSGGIYVPIEIYRLIERPSWFGFAIFAINVAIVAVMVRALLQRRRQAQR